MNIIELKNLNKSFGNLLAVNDLSLSVPKGSIYGFIGPNGSGKTTTIRMIMKIMYPDSGNILINGKEIQSARPENIGYMPEERGLYKKMKVIELLQFHSELNTGSYDNASIKNWLEKLGLPDALNKKVETLSKGMRQKLQFIATVLNQPEIIILDEPFGGLDPVNAEILKNALLNLQKKGSTIIFSTHDMSMAEKMCDYIFMIHNGKKVLDGTLTDIQNNYGMDTLQFQTEIGMGALEDIPGIEKINNFGKYQEVKITSGTDSQDILSKVMKKTKITKFEISNPSLNDIFMRIASPARKEAGNE